MKNCNIPLAIILKRTQNGYTFHSLQEVQSNKNKNQKPKLGRKPAQKGIPNRLIKQIGLSNQQIVSQITPIPEPQPLHHFQEEPQDHLHLFPQIHEEEQVQCEIDRQTELPKNPAIWFDKLKIHQIQKSELTEFFKQCSSKTPQLYMKYRNFIVESYQKNPRRYLSKITCGRILRGDVNTIMRIHEFLEKHGIINFSINYDGNYTFKPNSLAKSHEQRNKPQTVLKSLPDQDEQTAQKQIDTDNMTITVINKNFSRTYRACCTECKLICGIVWFANLNDEQNASQKNLCFQCWTQKNETEKGQYIKVDIVNKMQGHGRDGKNFPKNAWNIEENIKLLDFMSNTQKSWKKLLNDFGGKRSIEDIVLQFLQFPISNVNITQSKQQLYDSMRKTEGISSSVGFNQADYSHILREFYESSVYSRKGNKIQENGQKQAIKMDQKYESLLPTNESQQVGQMLTLTMEKILRKIQGLKQQEKLVLSQTNKYDCLVPYMIKTVKSKLEQQLLENKSKSLKNYQEKRNESSQFIQDSDAGVQEAQI